MTIAKATRIRALLCFYPCDLLSLCLSLFLLGRLPSWMGQRIKKGSIREGDSLNRATHDFSIFGFIVFVILCTRYYMRSIWDDRSFSCLNFNRDSSRYVTFKASEEFIDPFFLFFPFRVTYIANTLISIPFGVNKV